MVYFWPVFDVFIVILSEGGQDICGGGMCGGESLNKEAR